MQGRGPTPSRNVLAHMTGCWELALACMIWDPPQRAVRCEEEAPACGGTVDRLEEAVQPAPRRQALGHQQKKKPWRTRPWELGFAQGKPWCANARQ